MTTLIIIAVALVILVADVVWYLLRDTFSHRPVQPIRHEWGWDCIGPECEETSLTARNRQVTGL